MCLFPGDACGKADIAACVTKIVTLDAEEKDIGWLITPSGIWLLSL